MNPTPLACPACRTPHALHATVCQACGLVFGSQFPDQPLLPGQTLAQGRYTVERALSQGGMGALYLATEQTAAKRRVVIKVLRDYFDPNDPQAEAAARARLRAEAVILAGLQHPAIPQVFCTLEEGPHSYLVMEYIAGYNLEQGLTHPDDATGQEIPGQAYPQVDLLRWGIALCHVLEYLANQPQPLVHHDIKPANVIITHPEQDLFLVDFGTARGQHAAQDSGTVGMQQSSLYGTTGYAPPEQYRQQSEPRSDLYALAATLYHLATDDDPRAHPFNFPQLEQLGPLGEVLQAALDQDVTRRPTITTFREQLMILLSDLREPLLHAPDGTGIPTTEALVAWCEAHWTAAADWLYGSLPDQLERWWGAVDMATTLRSSVQQHADRNAGLDAVLAWLDPQGFGAEQPDVIIQDRWGFAAIFPSRYIALQPNTSNNWPLEFINTSRRYIHAVIVCPDWMQSPQPEVTLLPGAAIMLQMIADTRHSAPGLTLRGKVQLRDGSNILAQTSLEGQVFMGTGFTIVLGVSILLLFIMITIGLSYRDMQQAQPDTPVDALGADQRAGSPDTDPQTTVTDTPALASESESTQSQRTFRWYQIDQRGFNQKIAFSPDGRWLASLGTEGIKLWQVSDGTLRWTGELSGVPAITDLAFSPDSQIVAASGMNGVVQLWNTDNGALQQVISGDIHRFDELAFRPDNQTFLSSGSDITLWKIGDNIPIQAFDVSNVIALGRNGQTFATRLDYDTIQVWRVNENDVVPIRNIAQTPGSGLCQVVFSADGQQLAIQPKTGDTTVWDIKEDRLLKTLDVPCARENIHDVALTPDGVIVLVTSQGDAVKYSIFAQPAYGHTLSASNSSVTSAALSPDRQIVAASSNDGKLTLINIQP
jgi:serine/threonine protein kinase